MVNAARYSGEKKVEATLFQIWQSTSITFLKKRANYKSSFKVAHENHLVLTIFTAQVVQHKGKYPFIHANM